MAYQHDGTGIKMTLTSAADLSSLQFCFVKLTADNTAGACAATTDRPIGVLLNKPDAAGQAAEILVAGITKVKCSGVIAVGNNFGVEGAATSRAAAVTAPNANPAFGTAIEAGTANEIITASINCLASQPGS
jgi:hypothetical protein